jgi:hypothetical protein
MWQTPQSESQQRPKHVLMKSRTSLGLESMSALGHFTAVSHSRLVPLSFNPYYDYLLAYYATFIVGNLSLACPEHRGSHG